MKRALAGLALMLAALPASAGPTPATKPGGVVRVEHYDPVSTPTRGPVNALVTVEVFFAPSSMRRMPAYGMLEKLQAKHPTRVRIVYRVIQRNSQPPGPMMPTLALEAYAQGRFFEFVGAVVTAAQTMGMGQTRDQLLELGKKVGLDPARLDKAIAEDRYRDVITANEQRLDRLHGASPAVFFNDKPLKTTSSPNEADYDTAYVDAYDRALDLVDRGIEPKDLPAAFDAEVLRASQPVVRTGGPLDDEGDDTAPDHPLASPPLALAGLPSLGRPDADAPVPVVLLCRPNAFECDDLMSQMRSLNAVFRGEVRFVWAPWFDVAREDTADLSMLGDAALCAEVDGSSPDDLDASPGWQWVAETYSQIRRLKGRRVSAEKLIDDVAGKLHVDTRALSACRARLASSTLDFIAAARASGVVASPAVVIGGRIYHNLTDRSIIQQLVEAELAPGVLGRCSTTGC